MMGCDCDGCDCARIKDENLALMAENAELSAHIALLVRLEENRHDAEKQFGRALVEARGRVGERKL